MSTLVIILAGAALIVGINRPGILFGLAVHSYLFEEQLGGNAAIGFVVASLPFISLVLAYMRRPVLHFLTEDWILVALALYVTASVLWSPDHAVAQGLVARFLFLCVGGYFIVRYAALSSGPGIFIRDMVLTAAVFAILFGFSATVDVYGLRTVVGDGTAVGFSVAINFALTGCLALGLFTMPTFGRRRSIVWWLISVAAATALLPVAYSNGTRGVMVGSAAGIAAGGCLAIARFPPWQRLAVALATAVLIAASPLVVSHIAGALNALPDALMAQRYKDTLGDFATLMSGQSINDVMGSSTVARLYLWRTAWDEYLSNPVLGLGAGGMSVLHGTYAHNMLLEFAAEYGTLGLGLLGAFLALVGHRAWRLFRRADAGPERVAVIAIAMSAFVQSQLSLTLSVSKAFFICAGLIILLGSPRWRAAPKSGQLNMAADRADRSDRRPQKASPVQHPQ